MSSNSFFSIETTKYSETLLTISPEKGEPVDHFLSSLLRVPLPLCIENHLQLIFN